MKIIIDSENPVITNYIADAIWQSITKQGEDNQSLFNEIDTINIKVHVEKKKKPGVDWSRVDIGTKVFVADSKETLEDSILDAVFVSYDPRHNSFWALLPNGGKQPKPFSFCKLAEPIKPECEKK